MKNGRIRYYDVETLSQKLGPTRGASHVFEWKTKTGNARGWYESYDHFGIVTRVHPKYINRPLA